MVNDHIEAASFRCCRETSHVNSRHYSSMSRTQEGISQNTARHGEGEHREVLCLAEELLAIDGDWESQSLFSLRV